MKNIPKLKKTNFNLYSKENRRRYPEFSYPLTYSTYHLGEKYTSIINQQKCLKLKYTIYGFLFLLIISCFLFRSHVYLYNYFRGPFYIDEKYLSMKNDLNLNIKSILEWLWNYEYFQLELSKDPFHSQKKHERFHQYSKFPNQYHLGTYKRIVDYDVYVKLPTRRLPSFHHRFPFNWKLFSVITLQCIIQRLKSSNTNDLANIFIEKNDYVKFIDDQYNRNSTKFNILVLSHCGIYIGHFSRMQQTNVFRSDTPFQFNSKTKIFDISSSYISNELLIFIIVFHLILFAWAFLRLIEYLKELIEIRYNPRLIIPQEIIEELFLLNIEKKFEEKLILLDELIRETPYRLNNQLFVLNPNETIACIVLLRVHLNDDLNDFFQKSQSPFIICPISEIRKINFSQGISYRDDVSWIHWPSLHAAQQFNYADWLHHILIETNSSYQKSFDLLIRMEIHLNSNEDLSQNLVHRRRIHVQNITTGDDYQQNYLIREEETRRYLDSQRRSAFEQIFSERIPASPEFIAQFRLERLRNPKFCDLSMKANEISCQICLEAFEVDQCYAEWPCSSHIPHLFHFECMLKLLRQSNSCPLCRHQV